MESTNISVSHSPTEEALSGACICCGEQKFAPYLDGLECCAACGHVRALLSWTPDMFRQLYAERYFKGGEYADYEKEGEALRLNFGRRVRELALQYPEGGRLWEIGCAYGFFLQEAGGHFEASGCDVAEAAVKSAVEKQGVEAYCLDYLTFTPERPFDVICMWDTIEHLPEPHLFVEKAFNDLRSGGTLALTTGDIGSLCARLRGKRWRLIHPPTHVHYFTCNSMRQLLLRCGYTNVSFYHHAFWRNLETTLEKVLAENRFGNVVYSRVKRSGLLRVSFPLNLFDLMTVYATKP